MGENPVWQEPAWEFTVEPHDSTMSLRVFDDHMLSPALIGYCVHYVTDFERCAQLTRYELRLIDNQQSPVGTILVDCRFVGDKGPTTVSGLLANSKALFDGYLESFTGNEFLSKWKRKMLSESDLDRRWATFYYIVAVGSSPATTGLFIFTSDAPDSEVRGYFNLAKFHCNCKPITCPKGEQEGFKYMQLIQNPDRKSEMPLIVRCGLRDPKQRKVMSNFAAAANERIRKANPFAVQYCRAFDREMFQVSNATDDMDEDIPHTFVAYVKRYMQELNQGIPQVGQKREGDREHLFAYLEEMLDEVLGCKSLSEDCFRFARTFSGFVAAVTRQLMAATEPPLPKWIEATLPDGPVVWDHLQCLQEYQMRQLVEFAFFQSPKHNTTQFTTWAESLPEVKALQGRVNLNKEQFAQNMEHHDLNNTRWLTNIRAAGHGHRFDDVSSLAGLFMPGLEMIEAMGLARTMSQKVRMWAEALVTCTGIVNSTNGVEHPIGAEDVPSLVLFLTCAVNDTTMKINGGIAAQAKLTHLFCLDSMATDEERYGLPAAGVYVDVGDQYAFNAEKRAMSPQFSLLWLDDVLVMIAAEEELCATDGPSPRMSNALANSPDRLEDLTDSLDEISACFDLRDSELSPVGGNNTATVERVVLEEELSAGAVGEVGGEEQQHAVPVGAAMPEEDQSPGDGALGEADTEILGLNLEEAEQQPEGAERISVEMKM
eukprot:TRINITY_DN23480_c0_g1_i3.p1 TRINITY_DN23480_c0_g1~~TRINITY_DN23480_c0_g1_i3.p1  ORF type:complete len:713 (+),score=166.26 TRINITY_DN23480_c0_g1_i3:217-2355(+)